jgi:peptide/nickel transport system permease protein
MPKYILRRLLQVPLLLLGITLLTFTIINLAPGDPISAMIDPQEVMTLSHDEYQAMRERMGLNQPIAVRYLLWLTEIVQGNLGYSYQGQNLPVGKMILDRLPATLFLTLSAVTVAVVVGVTFGIITALRQYSLLDNGLTVMTFFGISVPGFFFALLGMYFFAVRLQWLPVFGMWTPGGATTLNWDLLRHAILPVSSLTILHVAGYMRYARTAILDELHSDHVMVARAKGLPEWVVVRRHILRNALLPIVTMVGLELPGLIGGAFIIESLFAWPGIGLLGYTAVVRRDYPLQMGIALILAVAVLVANLLTDIAYTFVDPRIRYE